MRITRRDCIYIKDTKRKYEEIAWRARTGGLPLRIHDNITGMDVVFGLEPSKEGESSSDWADKGEPVDVKGKHVPRCDCDKCMQVRMAKTLVANYEVMRENAGLPPLDEAQGVTKWQYGSIVELLSDLVDYKRDKPRPQAIEVYAQEILLTLGLEYKGGRK